MTQKPSVHSNIKSIEQSIERIKMLNQIRKITNDTAKEEIKRLELQLLEHINKLPEHEKQLYLIRKEFGKEF